MSRLTLSSLEAEVDGPPGDGGYRAQNSLERRRGEVHVIHGEKHVAWTHARPLGVRAFANLRDADPFVARPLLADRLEHEPERLLHADQALAGAVRVREAGASGHTAPPLRARELRAKRGLGGSGSAEIASDTMRKCARSAPKPRRRR